MLGLLRVVRSEGERAGLADCVIEVLSALPEDARLPGLPPTWLRRVREAFDDAPLASSTVADLARAAHVHPVSLSRAFRRHYGCSITDYRRRLRLRRAAAAIEASPSTLSRIAHEAGYADHPHLCRDFRDAAGVSPSLFRVLSRQG